MLRDRNLYAPLPPTSGGRLVPGTRRPRRTGNNIANGWGGGGAGDTAGEGKGIRDFRTLYCASTNSEIMAEIRKSFIHDQ